jgi:hypothetical protein
VVQKDLYPLAETAHVLPALGGFARREAGQCASERVRTLAAVGVDTDNVLEFLQTFRASAAPAAVAHAALRRVNLVIHGWRVDVDDAGQDLRQ